MTIPSRRKTNWGSQPRRDGPAPTDQPPAPEFLGTWRWRQADPLETTEVWFERTKRQRAEVIARASTWLHLGQTVKVHFDPRTGGGDVAGRIGTIYRLCNPVFADFVYVHFAASGREMIPRVRLLALEILTPAE